MGCVLTSLVLSIFSLFIYDQSMYSFISLIIAGLYIIVDTQIIIKKTEQGVFDVFGDAKELILDLFRIFIELISILSKEKKKDKK